MFAGTHMHTSTNMLRLLLLPCLELLLLFPHLRLGVMYHSHFSLLDFLPCCAEPWAQPSTKPLANGSRPSDSSPELCGT